MFVAGPANSTNSTNVLLYNSTQQVDKFRGARFHKQVAAAAVEASATIRTRGLVYHQISPDTTTHHHQRTRVAHSTDTFAAGHERMTSGSVPDMAGVSCFPEANKPFQSELMRPVGKDSPVAPHLFGTWSAIRRSFRTSFEAAQQYDRWVRQWIVETGSLTPFENYGDHPTADRPRAGNGSATECRPARRQMPRFAAFRSSRLCGCQRSATLPLCWSAARPSFLLRVRPFWASASNIFLARARS